VPPESLISLAFKALEIASTMGVNGGLARGLEANASFTMPSGPDAAARIAVNAQRVFAVHGSAVLLHWRNNETFPEMTVAVVGDLKGIDKTAAGSSDGNQIRISARNSIVVPSGIGALIHDNAGVITLPGFFSKASTGTIAKGSEKKVNLFVSVQGYHEHAFVYLWPLHIRRINTLNLDSKVPELLQPAQREVFVFLWDPSRERVVFTVNIAHGTLNHR